MLKHRRLLGRFNYHNFLRRFIGHLAWKDKETSRKRPNRRTGFLHPGHKRLYVDRHLVACDTSGSMDTEMLSQCLSTVNNISEYVPIDFMQFDHDTTEEPKPFKKAKKELTFKGRGGTCFEPVIEIAEQRRYKSVVIITDGCAGAPKQPKMPVLWVMPPGDYNPPVEWGKRVRMSLR